jgi:hypothetical protein
MGQLFITHIFKIGSIEQAIQQKILRDSKYDY